MIGNPTDDTYLYGIPVTTPLQEILLPTAIDDLKIFPAQAVCQESQRLVVLARITKCTIDVAHREETNLASCPFSHDTNTEEQRIFVVKLRGVMEAACSKSPWQMRTELKRI